MKVILDKKKVRHEVQESLDFEEVFLSLKIQLNFLKSGFGRKEIRWG